MGCAMAECGSAPAGRLRSLRRTGQQMPADLTVSPFGGFPAAAWEFYEQLTAQNTRDFWNSRRDVYQTSVRDPILALTQELAEEFGHFKVFRPNRDMRFSTDKSPYKTHQGAVT